MIKHLTPRTAKEIKKSLNKDKWHSYISKLNGKTALLAFMIILLSFVIFLDVVVFKENHSAFITLFITFIIVFFLMLIIELIPKK